MKSKLFVLIAFIVIVLISCTVSSFAYYSFLSLESNIVLENLMEKHRIKEIVLEKEEGIIWTVVIPKNRGVETEEIREIIYNDETGKFEAVYTFTKIIIINPEAWTRIIWGPAAKFFPFDVPKLCFIYDNNGTIPPPSGTPSDTENWYWLPSGDLEGSGSWIQWI